MSSPPYTLTPPNQPWIQPDLTPHPAFYRYLLYRLGSGNPVPNINTNNIWTGTNNFQGPFLINGATEHFPASGNIVGTTDTQLLTGKTIDGGSNTIGGEHLTGSGTNDSASAGQVGQFISSTVLAGSAISLTTATAADITSISLTAGDWDVWGSAVFAPAAGTAPTNFQGWISQASATLPTLPNGGAQFAVSATFAASATAALPVGATRVSLSATTTVYLSAQAAFTVSTMAAYGFIGARRRR